MTGCSYCKSRQTYRILAGEPACGVCCDLARIQGDEKLIGRRILR